MKINSIISWVISTAMLVSLNLGCQSNNNSSPKDNEKVNEPVNEPVGTYVSERFDESNSTFRQIVFTSESKGKTRGHIISVFSPEVQSASSFKSKRIDLLASDFKIETEGTNLKIAFSKSNSLNLPETTWSLHSVDSHKWFPYITGSYSQFQITTDNLNEGEGIHTVVLATERSVWNDFPLETFMDNTDYFYCGSKYQTSVSWANSGLPGIENFEIFQKRLQICSSPEIVFVPAGVFKTCKVELSEHETIWYGNVRGGVVKFEFHPPSSSGWQSNPITGDCPLIKGKQTWELYSFSH